MKITWFAVDCNLYTHPKVLKLSALLKTDVDTLVGKLGRLWAWAKLSKNEDGNISALPPQEIADIMRWKKSAAALFSALVECGFLDASEDGHYLHGWAELNGDITARKRRDSERKTKGNSTEIPRKKPGSSTEIPGTQYSTVLNSTEKEPSPDGDGKKEADKPPTRRRFVPPTVEQVAEYVQQRGSTVDPQGFIDFYEAKGWLIGKTPMKDWKAACRNAESWERWGPKGGQSPPSRRCGRLEIDENGEEVVVFD